MDGKKTYIIAAVAVAMTLAELFLNVDIPGFNAGGDPVGFILAALGLGTVRHAVAKGG